MDILGAFLADECVVMDEAWVAAIDLYDAYKRWAEAAGEHVVSQRRLGAALTERGFDRAKRGSERRWHWLGLGLVNPSANPRTHETLVSA